MTDRDYVHGYANGMHPIAGNRDSFVAGQQARVHDDAMAAMSRRHQEAMSQIWGSSGPSAGGLNSSAPSWSGYAGSGSSSGSIDFPEISGRDVLIGGAFLAAAAALAGLVAAINAAVDYVGDEYRRWQLDRDRQFALAPAELRRLAEQSLNRNMYPDLELMSEGGEPYHLFDGEGVVRSRPVRVVADVREADLLAGNGCSVAEISLEFTDRDPALGFFQQQRLPVCGRLFRETARGLRQRQAGAQVAPLAAATSDRVDDRDVSKAPALAPGLEGEAVGGPGGVGEGGQERGSTGAMRGAAGDNAVGELGTGGGGTGFTQPDREYRRERIVALEQADVVDAHAAPAKRPSSDGDKLGAHDERVAYRRGQVDNPGKRPEAVVGKRPLQDDDRP
jgi:hypothetical protein